MDTRVPARTSGPHPTALPEEVASNELVDFVLVGEAERSMLQLCRHLGGEGEPVAVPGLVYQSQGGVVSTDPAPMLEPEHLDELPFPRYELMNIDAYFEGTQTHGLFQRGQRVLPIMTGRGCPSRCTYCCRVMGHRIRNRGADSVMAEVRHLVDRYRIDELYIEDDNFTVDRDRALDILGRLERFQPALHLKFANGVRADRVDQELLAAMRRARVYALSFGIESGSPSTLKKMRKGLNLDRARENVLLAKSMGFHVGSNCIIGYPGERPEDIRESLDFFLRLPLDSMAIVNLVPFPGTEARRVCEANGYLTEASADWGNYFFSIRDPIPLIETPFLSSKQQARAIRRAYRRMYMRPRWLLRTARHVGPRKLVEGGLMMLGLTEGRRAG